MDCHDFEERMNEVLDRRCRPERDVLLQNHADRCSDCKRVLLVQSQLFQRIIASEVQPVRHRSERKTSVARHSGQLVRYVAVVAVTTMVAWVVATFRPVAEPTSNLVAVKSSVERVTGQRVKGQGAEPSDDSVSRGLPHPASPRTTEASQLASPRQKTDSPLHSGSQRPTSSALAVGLPGQVALSLAQWDQRSLGRVLERETGFEWHDPRWLTPVQDGFEPLAKSATSTMNVLRLTWPAHRPRRPRSADGAGLPPSKALCVHSNENLLTFG